MKQRMILTPKILLRVESGRVQLFNHHFYRLCKGKAFRQMVTYENGVQQFNDFGKEVEILKIYDQIKLVFDPEGKIVAVRPAEKESLLAKDDSIWSNFHALKPEPMSNALKCYYEHEALEYYRWIKRERRYCSQKYGKKKNKGATC
ncbi:hypothetical protein [Enterococcus wangshanyuanii]|uniref:Uncharacterized protein n=1 Tax=Enterococcus wangshanyuanii TaxID=2005703 RepID=A0ABQ1PR30_9ENTE|nr:hypothetical protein [Enterococcus wangshanyuanii]GGD01517.1 hypothetical protein GCM10011573_33890 [Enterococcus wangshanyuanii]